MIGRGLLALTVLAVLSTCVLSLPATPSQLENEDVKVMKCIVQALAEVLSRPRPMPVSQECLVTLKTDDRLVSILRHHNFLKELQEIAVQGGQERAQPHGDAGEPEPTPQTDEEVADRSMLEALGGPGERSILTQKRSRTGSEDREEEKDDSKAEKSDEGDSEEKKDNSEEENMIRDKKSAGFAEKRDAPRIKSKGKKLVEEGDVEIEKRSPFFSHRPKQKEEEEEDEGEMKRGSSKRWNKRGKLLRRKSKAVREEAQERGAPHHSKEVSEEEEEKKKKKKRNRQRSPEQKELQMIAWRRHGWRGLEEEGSGSQKSEEPEIERLAAIESELENVAQRLHGMRRG